MSVSKKSTACELSHVLYCKTLKRKLRKALQNKRRGTLTHGVVILHDNARPDTGVRTQAMVEHFNWEFFDHPMLGGGPCPHSMARPRVVDGGTGSSYGG
jgi:hypothetical protein